MSSKTIDLPNIGKVTFTKNTRSKSIKIHINGSKVKVTYPRYTSLAIAKSYAIAKKNWIIKHRTPDIVFHSGDLIGKKHKLLIEHYDITRPSTTISNYDVLIKLPLGMESQEERSQKFIRTKVETILKIESEEMITERLRDLSYEHSLDFKSVYYKKLSRRWGSCDSHKNLIFNIYLIQLPWEIIDYVICHELAHTVEMNHSTAFWRKVEELCTDYKSLRKEIQKYPPESIVQ